MRVIFCSPSLAYSPIGFEDPLHCSRWVCSFSIDTVHWLSNADCRADNRTRGSWLRNTNTTSVLCLPPEWLFHSMLGLNTSKWDSRNRMKWFEWLTLKMKPNCFTTSRLLHLLGDCTMDQSYLSTEDAIVGQSLLEEAKGDRNDLLKENDWKLPSFDDLCNLLGASL